MSYAVTWVMTKIILRNDHGYVCNAGYSVMGHIVIAPSKVLHLY